MKRVVIIGIVIGAFRLGCLLLALLAALNGQGWIALAFVIAAFCVSYHYDSDERKQP